MSKIDLSQIWARVIVEELVRLGCRHFLLSPGSRSTPLALAIARHPKIRLVVGFDERSVSFCAVGASKAASVPSVMLVTSGTAVSNLMPAVTEASLDEVPLILLTADRPFELRNVGANQTIDQVKIFGGMVRGFWDVPVASEEVSIQTLLSTVDEAFTKSLHPQKGPVQVNCMFREPFSLEPYDKLDGLGQNKMQRWINEEKPYRSFCSLPEKVMSSNQARFFGSLLSGAKSGLIVVGSKLDENQCRAIVSLANKLKWPVLSSIVSGLSFLKEENVFSAADLLLEGPDVFKNNIDVVLQFGGHIVSKKLQKTLEDIKPEHYILISEHSSQLDPGCMVTNRIYVDAINFSSSVESFVRENRSELLEGLQKRRETVESVLAGTLDDTNTMSEAFLARYLSDSKLSRQRPLFLSNSMPIRDMDTFAKSQTFRAVFTNRGASGIDGITSSAVGVSLGLRESIVLLVGDLAFLHDTNGLSLLSQLSYPMLIVLVNNGGGGIFSYLPVSKAVDVHEQVFTAPQNVDLKRLSEAYGLLHVKVESVLKFTKAYEACLNECRHVVLEVVTDKKVNVAVHQDVKQIVASKITKIEDI